MCYILVKDFNKHGCFALKTKPGKKLVNLKVKLEDMTLYLKDKDIEVVLVSNPKMYGEYAPYRYVKTEEELIERTKKMINDN